MKLYVNENIAKWYVMHGHENIPTDIYEIRKVFGCGTYEAIDICEQIALCKYAEDLVQHLNEMRGNYNGKDNL